MKINFFSKNNTKRRNPPERGNENMFMDDTNNSYSWTRKKHKLFSKRLDFAKFKIKTDDKSKKWFFGLVLIVLLTLIISFLFKGAYFQVSKFEVTSLDWISNIDFAYKVVNDFAYENIFTFKEKAFISEIKNIQPNLKKISVNKWFPNTLKVELESFLPVYQTFINGKNYLILENGSFVPLDKQNETIGVLNIYNMDFGVSWNLSYKKPMSSEILNNIKYVSEWIAIVTPDVKIEEMNLFLENRELHLKVNDTILIFDLVGDLKSKLLSYEIFFNKSQTWDEVYVDLRLEERFDICPREPENIYENQEMLEKACMERLKQIYEYNF